MKPTLALNRRQFASGLLAAACAPAPALLFARTARADAPAAPAALASDFLVCRRLHLDICGRLPARAETEAFVASRDPGKAAALAARLLASDDFADYWSMHLCDILRVKSEFPINLWPNAVYVYHRRIRAALAADEPYDAFARALLGGLGSNFRVPEANFLRAAARRTPEGLSEAVSTTFLTRPTEDYAPYFSRVAFKPTREWKEEVVYLNDGPADLTPAAFAERLVAGDLRGEFVRAHVRHVHWWLFGVLPPPARETAWAEAFESAGLRLKPFLAGVFASGDYLAAPGRSPYPARRLDAEVIDDAIADLTGLEHNFVSIAPEPFTYIPKTRRAVLLEDGSITSPFLLLFGRPARDTGLLTERNNAITAKQRLYLFNSGRLAGALGQMLAAPPFAALNRPARIDELYYRFLSRPPADAERALIDASRLTPRDVAWILLNSREFLYRT